MWTSPQPSRAAFTLIELSVVLVVISLLVGGILMGAVLIQAAEIRKQLTQIEEIQLAHNTFKMKYNALAGDMCQETASYGLDCGNPTGPRDNGQIDDMLGNVGFTWVPTYEPLYFFGHLIDAGLYKKLMTCEEPPSGNITYGHFALSLNPAQAIMVFSYQSQPWLFLGLNAPTVAGACDMSNISTLSTSGVISAAEAYSLETKIDDGVPSTGIIRATILNSNALDGTVDNNVADCVTDATSTAYHIQNTARTCRLMVKL